MNIPIHCFLLDKKIEWKMIVESENVDLEQKSKSKEKGYWCVSNIKSWMNRELTFLCSVDRWQLKFDSQQIIWSTREWECAIESHTGAGWFE